MPQKTSAVTSEEIAYSSPSTAENQNVSENAYASAPNIPLPMIAGTCFDSRALSFTNTFRTRWVMVQKRNKIANALHRADRMFIINAALEVSPPAKSVAILPIIINRGAPGG
jgi:hypothetical protein